MECGHQPTSLYVRLHVLSQHLMESLNWFLMYWLFLQSEKKARGEIARGHTKNIYKLGGGVATKIHKAAFDYTLSY